MIDFACKKFDLEEVIKCSLALSKSEFRLLSFLIKNDGDFQTETLSRKLGLDKSTIQRSIKKLHVEGLVFRRQKNKTSGGYVFYYSVKDKNEIKKRVKDIIHNWVKVFEDKIEKW